MNRNEPLDNFRKACQGGRMAHAYLVVAPPRGAGLEFVEQALSMLFCQSESKPCGQCRGCSQVARHTHPDTVWVEPEKKSRLISVEQVRLLQRLTTQTALEGGWKACVVIAADRLGMEASNAFLKTLEEPTGPCIFMLLTENPHLLLTTILSRCQRLVVTGDHEGLPPDLHAEVQAILEEATRGPSRSVSGIRAMSYAERLTGLLKRVRDAILKEESVQASSDAREESDEVLDARVEARYREVRSRVVHFILTWYRDLLVMSVGAPDQTVINRDRQDAMRERSASLSFRDAVQNVRVIEAMETQWSRNLQDHAVLTSGFMQLK